MIRLPRSATTSIDVARSPAGGGWVTARLVLFGLLIAGLVGMHQLPGTDDCCATSTANSAVPVGVEAVDRSSIWAPMPPRPTTSLVATAAVMSPVEGAPVSVLDLLGMCLALLGALGGLLMAGVLARWGRATRTDGSPRGASAAAAAPRAPPPGRHLGRLQVLRL